MNEGAKMTTSEQIGEAYGAARDRYRERGVDTESALATLSALSVSMNCWQADDVTGLEGAHDLSGGILATGNYPGRARSAEEIRRDAEFAFGLIPGRHRFNLHAIYGELDGADRDEVMPEHFQLWVEWAQRLGIGLDFNPTFFSHPKADAGLTLAHPDKDVRNFWIAHGRGCRAVAAHLGGELGCPCVNNLWIPDGMKDETPNRYEYRKRLVESLDAIFETEYEPEVLLDAVEGKLFGIESESCVVGSNEFYFAYALARGVMLCLDAGHFHPTERVGDKISTVLAFSDRLLLHLSRPIRWDSDHVVIFDDETRFIAQEVVRAGACDRVHLAVDFFDASINRISAWVVGMRATIQALLFALLEPVDMIREEERAGNYGARLALLEEAKMFPFGAVWDEYCRRSDVPIGAAWLRPVADYERDELLKRV
jgi:L-rhamnose isomerase